MRGLAKLPRLPTTILGIEGDPIDLLLWNLAIMGEDAPVDGAGRPLDPKMIDKMKFPSVRDRILAKRRAMGIPRVV